MKHLKECMEQLFGQELIRHAAIRVGRGEQILAEYLRGTEQPVTPHTRFDMASLTKIEATTMLALMAIDKGYFTLDTRASDYLNTRTASSITVRQLMTHTMGIGHKSLVQDQYDYSSIAEFILSIPSDVPAGTEVLYSCPGYILLGKMVEKAWGMRLDQAFMRLVARPLGMTDTTFLPEGQNLVNNNLEEADRGKVNDYNARFLGGVCGNAGLFSHLEDSTRFVTMLLRRGAPLISRGIFDEAIRNHTPGMSESRGLGFLYVDERYTQTGGLFPTGSIGHCGHTGQSIYVDLNSGLYVIVLSDATISIQKKVGFDRYSDVIAMRGRIHSAIHADLKEAGLL